MRVDGSEEATNNLLGKNGSNTVRVEIKPMTPKTLSHLPARPAINLGFHNLTYTVKEGRKNSKYIVLSPCSTRSERECVLLTSHFILKAPDFTIYFSLYTWIQLL